jgi:hypothetical protein
LTLKVDIPGGDPAGVEISIDGGTLKPKGASEFEMKR